VIEIATIRDARGIARLLPEWEELWQRDPAAMPFQAPAWQIPWWRHFGTAEPLLLTARSGGELVGLLPLYLLREPGCRKLLPIGVGVSDYIAALLDPRAGDRGDMLITAIADAKGWDECWLPDLKEHGALAKAAAGTPLRTSIVAAPPCPVLKLPDARSGLGAVVPRKMQRDLRQVQTRSAAAGGVRFESVDSDRLDAAMDDLFRLHEQRWQMRGEAGVCADPRVQSFHRQVARALLAAGMLRFYRLWIGGALAAVYYGFAAKGTAYAYLGGFDPSQARLSPGAQIMAHAIGEAAAEGAAHFDFLRGGESYKYAWGAVDRGKISRHLSRACPIL
jgi:CelD/BcsL family acetyltransferase involved in cellulose biosynthesis